MQHLRHFERYAGRKEEADGTNELHPWWLRWNTLFETLRRMVWSLMLEDSRKVITQRKGPSVQYIEHLLSCHESLLFELVCVWEPIWTTSTDPRTYFSVSWFCLSMHSSYILALWAGLAGGLPSTYLQWTRNCTREFQTWYSTVPLCQVRAR